MLFANNAFIPLVLGNISFLEAVFRINQATRRGINITAAIVQKDDGVLIKILQVCNLLPK